MMRRKMHDRSFSAALADAVRRRREELGLRQVELAELANCSTRFVHTVESGKATVRLDKLLTVLQVLGLQLQFARGKPESLPGGEP
ncbi:MAG: type II toxin-antitoxin system Y4mF family antitoxin [Planctomycetes bacterium]|nr:type II toxin-antitoxin system Y4mF family antitoxin [Planctomycetota bacterium]